MVSGPAFVVGGDALGTPESEWAAWPELGALPELTWPTRGRVVVVAPHPDDEVLGVGGLLRLASEQGTAIDVVAVTDGEACRLDWCAQVDVERRRAIRRAEVRAALRVLDVRADVVHCALPDGSVAAHEEALAELLAPRVAGAAWCLAPWRGDGHPDHEAAGRAAATAAERANVPLAEYPVWAWHWAVPGDGRLPWDRARRVDLPDEVGAAKAAAIAEFASQLEPAGAPGADAVLPAAVVERFHRPFEVVFV